MLMRKEKVMEDILKGLDKNKENYRVVVDKRSYKRSYRNGSKR